MKLLRSVLTALTALALPTFGLASRAAAQEVDGEVLYKKVVKSYVFIVTPVKGGYGMGSGSLIDADKRLVLTNFHVVDEENIVFVQFPTFMKDGEILYDKQEYMRNIPSGRAIKGKVLYRDKSRDLAIVQLDRIPAGTPAIPLAKKSARPRGHRVEHRERGRDRAGIPGGQGRGVRRRGGEVPGGRRVGGQRVRGPGQNGDRHEADEPGRLRRPPVRQARLPGRRRGEREPVGQPGEPLRRYHRGAGPPEREEDSNQGAQRRAGPEGDGSKKGPKKDVSTTTVAPRRRTRSSRRRRRTRTPSHDGAAPGHGPVPGRRRRPPTCSGGPRCSQHPDNKEYYMGRLHEIIKKYPGTAAAKEAKKILDGLK